MRLFHRGATLQGAERHRPDDSVGCEATCDAMRTPFLEPLPDLTHPPPPLPLAIGMAGSGPESTAIPVRSGDEVRRLANEAAVVRLGPHRDVPIGSVDGRTTRRAPCPLDAGTAGATGCGSARSASGRRTGKVFALVLTNRARNSGDRFVPEAEPRPTDDTPRRNDRTTGMTSNWRRWFTGIAVAAAMFGASAAHGSEPVRVGWVYAMANAPVLIAESEGYFEEQGLEVALESFTSGPLIRKGLNGGTLDMAFIGVPPIVHWVAKGADLVIVAKVNYGQASLMARREAGITRVEDLAGRRLAGVREKSGMDVLLRGYVLGEVGGLMPSDLSTIKTMPVAEMGPALEAGDFDAAFMWEPFVARMLARRSARVILNVNRVEPYYPWYVIAARREFVDAYPERVKSMLRAHRQAIRHLNSSPNAGNAVIANAFELEQETGPDGKVYSPEEIVKRARSRLGWEWDLNEDDRDFIERLMGWSTSLGFIEAPVDIDSLLDLGPLRRVRRERR